MAMDIGWTLDSKWTKVPLLKQGDSNGPIGVGFCDSRRNSSLGRCTCVGILVLLTVILIGAFCFLLQQATILRLETERLKLRVRVVELQVQRCNALLPDGGEADDGWFPPPAEESPRQTSAAGRSDAVDSEADQGDGPTSILSSPPFPASSPSSSSSLLAKSSSSSSSPVSPWRRKRNAANKKPPKKEKEKQKTQKENLFAVSFDTERPGACKLSNCLSLIGWKPSSWVDTAHHRLYNELSGQLEVPVAGVHYIYAQVTYETVSALEAFAIMVDTVQLGRCLTGVDYVNPTLTSEDNSQRKTCHTGLAVHLRKGQKIWIKSLHMEGERVSAISMKHSSFWGVVRLSAK